jgi:hypothetical protein
MAKENGIADNRVPFSASTDLNPNKNVGAILKTDQKTVKQRTNAELVEI